ncbi:MAG: hypothetical protein ACXVB9_17325 [Bdellovibrionota bacterium]
MKLSRLILTGLTFTLTFAASAALAEDEREPHAHFHRGAQRSATGSSALMTYHKGPVIHSGSVKAIFWGASWNNATFAGDKIAGIDSFFQGFAGSRYSQTGSEYTDGAGNHVTGQITYLNHVVDTSAPPLRALRTSQAVTEACKVAGNNPDPNALYLIYTSTGAGNVNYCAWHSWGNCSNGKPVQVAYMPNLDGVAGCNPGDTVTGHSEGLAALANVTAHELMETLTDPRGSAWYDGSGQENGDKCAWEFPAGNGVSTLANGSNWMLQMEWSNAAYQAGTGLPNYNGQKGCVY